MSARGKPPEESTHEKKRETPHAPNSEGDEAALRLRPPGPPQRARGHAVEKPLHPGRRDAAHRALEVDGGLRSLCHPHPRYGSDLPLPLHGARRSSAGICRPPGNSGVVSPPASPGRNASPCAGAESHPGRPDPFLRHEKDHGQGRPDPDDVFEALLPGRGRVAPLPIPGPLCPRGAPERLRGRGLRSPALPGPGGGLDLPDRSPLLPRARTRPGEDAPPRGHLGGRRRALLGKPVPFLFLRGAPPGALSRGGRPPGARRWPV